MENDGQLVGPVGPGLYELFQDEFHKDPFAGGGRHGMNVPKGRPNVKKEQAICFVLQWRCSNLYYSILYIYILCYQIMNTRLV